MDEFTITLSSEQNCYITSDYHYGHKNIVKGVTAWDGKDQCRDFNTIEEMNDRMVKATNSIVAPDDWLICLGDWSFGGIENIWNFRKRLNVENIILILGNHDKHITNNNVLPNVVKEIFPSGKTVLFHDSPTTNTITEPVRARDIFNIVSPYCQLRVKYPNHAYTADLNHKPLASWQRMSSGRVHFFGHCHLKGDDRFVFPGRCMDIGVEGNEYKPYDFRDLYKHIEQRPIKNFKFYRNNNDN